MGGVQSGTHNLGGALWVQERQKQKCNRDGSKYDSNGSQSQNSTQERRKLLKRTRSLAVITEDEANRIGSAVSIPGCVEGLGTRIDVSYETTSLQHRKHHHQQQQQQLLQQQLHHHHHQLQQQQQHHQQLIPRAKLIDRNSLKDRLSKSQQHLSECYNERFGGNELPALRACQSRSVCGLYNSLPPPLDSLPDPLPYTRAGGGGGFYRPGASATLRPDRINILKWPDSPRRYRSYQDLNTVSGLVDIVEDNRGWPGVDEENRSLDCIYTQVKRKRKEHRSLDSILFEDDSDELEYFDVLNLLPLSNVRLEIDEPDSNAIQEINGKNRDCRSNPTIISVSAKRRNGIDNEKCYKQHLTTPRITEIKDDSTLIGGDENKATNHQNSETLKNSAGDRGITSFSEIARDKHHYDKSTHSCANNLDLLKKKKNNQQTKELAESCSKEKHSSEKIVNNKHDQKDLRNIQQEENRNNKEKTKVEETEDTKSIWISDNEEAEDMSRRPLVLRVVDSDITKHKGGDKSIVNHTNNNKDVSQKENICENKNMNYKNSKVSNKPDLINDHVHQTKNKTENKVSDKENRLSVENAKNFFEKKKSDNEQLTNGDGDGKLDKIVKETAHIISKGCNTVKGSLGFEARSESSDLGLGSEIGSDVRRLSVDENTNVIVSKMNGEKHDECDEHYNDMNNKNQKNYTNLTRSRSCMDSIECQDEDEPEFDHVRYKILKSHVFSKSMFNNAKKDGTYDGLMQYLREYSFQDLLMDNNVVIIEPVRAEIDRKPSFNDSKLKSSSSCRIPLNSLEKSKTTDTSSSDEKIEKKGNHFKKAPRQSSLRKHFFYQPIRVNREMNDDELPDPDTVRNVRRMFEESMKSKLSNGSEFSRDCSTRKSVSMKDLRSIESRTFECSSEKAVETSRSRCSSRAKDLTKLFENLEKSSSPPPPPTSNSKDEVDGPRTVESRARTIAQSFEARSNQSSPSNSNSSKVRRYQQLQRQLHNWDAGSVSSGVSSDYPDTDAGSAPACTSSEDEEVFCYEDDEERYQSHYVPPDVLKKIREYGTSVTYYGGKVVNTCNGPLICPMVRKTTKGSNKSLDFVKFRLVKSNSCDSRLELTGRVINSRGKCQLSKTRDKSVDLRQFTIDETPSIEITPIEQEDANNTGNKKTETKEEKREPPVVIGLEPKKEEDKMFKADFKLGKLEDCASINRFTSSALSRWQINENAWKRNSDFGKMEFEEFEVLEDSLNGVDN